MFVLFALACTTPPDAPAPAPEAPAPVATPETPELDKAMLEKTAKKVALVPSTVETQKALEAAGIDTKLATLIPEHDFEMTADDVEHAAVRTGVVLADLLLTVKSAEKAQVIEHLEAVRVGMKQLNGGDDIDRTIADYIETVKADGMSRDDLLKEFDELSGAVIPELEFNKQSRVVPLIQAGSWLEAAHLVATAAKAKAKPEAADGLLKQPAVVDYFIGYVKGDAGDKAPAQVGKRLEESLMALKGVASKEGPLVEADLDTVIKSTSDVLALL